MRKAKVEKIILDKYGSYLGMQKGCFIVRDKHGKEQKYPLFEEKIGEVVLKTGNTVSIGALASLGFWEIDTLILTRRGRPVAMLKSVEYDSHAKTRLSQYEAYKNSKGLHIAKQIVLGKIRGQNRILRKHGLNVNENVVKVVENIESDNLRSLRRRLLAVEGKYARHYFNQIFQLFPEWLRPRSRKTFKAFDGLNNVFNLAYQFLAWKIHIALIRAKLEPYLGFLHSIQFGKPSLVCDFQELYRYLIDDFIIQHCTELKRRDFSVKHESLSRKRKGKREYLNNLQTRDFMKNLYRYFQTKVEIPRIRVGKRQEIETLINEEAYLLAKYLRNERETWKPRITLLN
ncbi:MAG: CRISPR-associated endonuclease Cas1 [Candidatus Bathyarchaeota archaeon]|nr:CRISPR-associated endonuclease Cas1 [Candidatus Bathyarchaeota archaeon]